MRCLAPTFVSVNKMFGNVRYNESVILDNKKSTTNEYCSKTYIMKSATKEYSSKTYIISMAQHKTAVTPVH